MANILVFGDSIAYGKGDSRGGWSGLFRSFLEEKWLENDTLDVDLLNLAMNYGTTETLLLTMESEAKARLSENKTIIIIAIGINDSQIKSGENRIPINCFGKNIRLLIKIAKSISADLIFLGLTPVNEAKVDPIPWSKMGYSYLNSEIEKYNDMLKIIFEEENIMFIDFWQTLNTEKYREEMLSDGVHPNAKGHQIMFEIIRDELEEKGII